MKKALILVTVLLLLLTTLLAACGDGNTESSEVVSGSSAESTEGSRGNDGSKSENDESKAENNESKNENNESKNENNDESSKSEQKEVAKLPTEYVEGGMNIELCSFTEEPYFALIGRCENGATVTGEAGGETVVSESYMGWYSLRLPCKERTVDVKLSQSVNGKQVGETVEYTVKPATPGKDMWPVVTGGDFQFFFKKMLPDFRGENLPNNASLNNLKGRTKNKLNQLRQNNPDAEIIYMLVPSAMSVYPELVPAQYKQASGDTKYDLIANALTEAGATVIDIKGAFEEHKNDEMPLYYKLDSHWSDYGAFVAYTELFNHIMKKFPEATARPADDFDWNPDYYQSGDMSYYLAKNATEAVKNQQNIKEFSYFREFLCDVPDAVTKFDRYVSSSKLTYNDVMTYENYISTGNSKLPDCIVLRDSYSTQLYDILAERMNNTHYYGMWNYTWDAYSISSESPDYVIYIVAEWNLDSVLYN